MQPRNHEVTKKRSSFFFVSSRFRGCLSCRVFLVAWIITLAAVRSSAQSPAAARLAILQAEDRRAPTNADLATIRSGARSGDPQTVRMAVRALGRLERPALIADISPVLHHSEP